MTLADGANIALMVGGCAAAVTVYLLFREVRENNRLTRTANTQALVQLASPFYLGIFGERETAELCLRGAREYEALDKVDRYRYRHFLIWWLIFHENVYYQWRNGLLDDHSYKPWLEDLKLFTLDYNLSDHWIALKGLFQTEFAEHVELLLPSA
jgi:hypothetical protein